MPLDHVLFYIPGSKLEQLVTFLTTSLAHVGFKEHLRPVPNVVGLGEDKPYIWFMGMPMDSAKEASFEEVAKPPHIAFSATATEQVDAFHANGLKAGGIDNGAPGPRPQYIPGYYGAFVKDPGCGINFEMVYKGGPNDSDAWRELQERRDAQRNA